MLWQKHAQREYIFPLTFSFPRRVLSRLDVWVALVPLFLYAKNLIYIIALLHQLISIKIIIDF